MEKKNNFGQKKDSISFVYKQIKSTFGREIDWGGKEFFFN